MKAATLLMLTLTGLLLFGAVQAHSATFSSSGSRNTLLELYTSEGCGSCPPAERWFGKLRRDPRLWKTLFPVAFHVDYWNGLGWKDIYSAARYSQRQRTYAAHGYAGSVYTPGFFRNGREWRGFFAHWNISLDEAVDVGMLSADVTARRIDVAFAPVTNINATRLHVAILGFDKTTAIHSGENAGKVLRHDFVVLAYQHYSSASNRWQITDHVIVDRLAYGGAVVFWLTQDNDPTPLQVTGGWLGEY